ncbi:hypothetical protein BESB_055190 [Besnoitia besnoiti]|uniref:Transmembrane protein n=1 Tax=Besnoitia besnoiti TaxID=94643 RepID=A0A2A9MBL3_BESBE|nr:hypothetical protein BESB_055190 [Besnoitia besnoiti]PFH35868.1 hypothetical protein BESB_055190 [Besnoitia besnoiti]
MPWMLSPLRIGFMLMMQAFVEVGARGIFDMLNNMFLGGAGSADPNNFEGGNQGSFFNFMFPLQSDYPWACVCDPALYLKWEQKEAPNVPCRNQADMSAQGVTAYCNPLLHKMNNASRQGLWAFILSCGFAWLGLVMNAAL